MRHEKVKNNMPKHAHKLAEEAAECAPTDPLATEAGEKQSCEHIKARIERDMVCFGCEIAALRVERELLQRAVLAACGLRIAVHRLQQQWSESSGNKRTELWDAMGKANAELFDALVMIDERSNR